MDQMNQSKWMKQTSPSNPQPQDQDQTAHSKRSASKDSTRLWRKGLASLPEKIAQKLEQEQELKDIILAEEPILAGVSGGPDSMALAEILYRLGARLEVAHVNYHKRPTALRDERIVRDWCIAHDVPFHLLDAGTPEGNFQAWARDERYEWFEKLMQQRKIKTLAVAHQKDDVLETWQMQKERHILCECYGLAKSTVKNGQKRLRPLLQLSKDELEKFCQVCNIPYGIDESNLSDDYLRNRIRHSTIEKMSEDQKEAVLAEIASANEELAGRRAKARAFLKSHASAALLEQPDGWFLLDEWICRHNGRHYGKAFLKDLCRQLQSQHTLSDLDEDFWIEREGDEILIHRKTPEETAPMVIESMEELQKLCGKAFGHAEARYIIANKGRTIESFAVCDDDFPLRFEPAASGDVIALRYGNKKLSRIWIDQKVSRFQRKVRFVVKNRHNTVIFVPDTGCDVNHFSPNPVFYMVKC